MPDWTFIFGMSIESGEIVHFIFEGYFIAPVETEYFFAFHEIISDVLVKKGLLNKYTIGTTFCTTVHMERIITGLSPGDLFFTMAISWATNGMGFYPRFLMAQTLVP